MAKKRTIFQTLDSAISGNWNLPQEPQAHVNSYDMTSVPNKILYKTDNKEDYERKKLELRQSKYLKEKWFKINQDLTVQAFNGLNQIKLMYNEADLMDAMPEIGAALDTYSDEACLEGSTKIKLLNGETKTIKELFDEGLTDFWVYAVDTDGEVKPAHIDKVLYKGKKKLAKITLDDNTVIKSTYDHKWLLSSNEWVETQDLQVGASLMSIYDKLNYLGYEKVKSTNGKKFRPTHQIVSEAVNHEDKVLLSKNNFNHEKIVIHHTSFNKLNNDPRCLKYMLWSDHQNLHLSLNRERWKNEDFSAKMRRIFSETAKKMWSEKGEEIRRRMRDGQRAYIASLTKEERNNIFGRQSEQNGMFGVKRYGAENPNYDNSKNHVNDIDEQTYVQFIITTDPTRDELCKHFNLSPSSVADYNASLCSKYDVDQVSSIKYKVLNDAFLRIIDELSQDDDTYVTMKVIEERLNVSSYVASEFLKRNDIDIKTLNSEWCCLKHYLPKEITLHDIVKDLGVECGHDYIGFSMLKYGITKKMTLKLFKYINKIYNLNSIKDVKYQYWKEFTIPSIRERIRNGKTYKIKDLCDELKCSNHEFNKLLNRCGYINYDDFTSKVWNHRIVGIELTDEIGDVYDLFNSSTNSCFGVKCNRGQIISHNCLPASDGNVIQVYSKSSRVKSILEDLFVNRLNVQITSQMIIRGMCKYGNQFMVLDVDEKHGVKGWKQLPVFEVERLENGVQNPYGGLPLASQQNDNDTSTQFIWTNATVGGGVETHFRNWQIAHFRLLNNSMYLPYGCSILNSARRHWRMLSLMEDMMLIYRLERSMERRVYKIFVGGIDDADVQAYVETVANNFKRTPIIDPLTGQIDLRKNILPVHKDTPIPLLDGRTITIEQLAREYENGKDNYVYSIQDKTHKIVPGKVVWCGKNYTAKKLVKITLDDDSHMIMAPEHEIIMRDGSKKRADEVVAGESVMPFYRKVESVYNSKVSKYEMVYDPNSGDYEYTHRLIARAAHPNREKNEVVVHHINFNRFDNTPENLKWMTWPAHNELHGKLANDPMIRELRRKTSSDSWLNEESRNTRIRKMTVCFPQSLWDEIDELVGTGVLQTQNEIIDYINSQRIDDILAYNYSKKLFHNKKITKGLMKCRLKERGFNTIDEYFDYIDGIYGLVDRKQIDFERRSNFAKKYKVSDNLGGDWRKNNPNAKAIEEKIKESLKAYYNSDEFINDVNSRTDFITMTYWNDILDSILGGVVKTTNDLYHFINDEILPKLIDSNPTSYFAKRGKISKKRIIGALKEKFNVDTFEDFMSCVKKNHKIKSVEYVEGADVYCMTVTGLNGEDDRHNFALKTWDSEGCVTDSGVFVANCWDQDIFIPTRSQDCPNPIDTLSAGQNLTAMDDIKYVQNKILAALRIPKSFINFEEAAGEGKNLALMDVRFTRMVNRVQQAFLMEMTKVATIHLYLMGFEDDLTNFTLAMNNPSTQAEQLEVEVLQKKIDVVRDAVSDPGNGLQVMSLQRALKDVMKWSEKDIKTNLEEIRLEKAIAAELEKTQQIIKKTGIFDSVDRIYGEPGAQYADEQPQQGGEGGGMGGGMPGMGGGGGPTDFGDAMDGLDNAGGDMGGDINGLEGEEPTADMGGGEGGAPPMENAGLSLDGVLINESKAFNTLMERLNDETPHASNTKHIHADVYDNAYVLNEEIDKMLKSLDEFGKTE